MWYTSYTNDSGVIVNGKSFETLEKAKAWACKNPKVITHISNKEPDLLGRAFSANRAFNQAV